MHVYSVHHCTNTHQIVGCRMHKCAVERSKHLLVRRGEKDVHSKIASDGSFGIAFCVLCVFVVFVFILQNKTKIVYIQ